ncbi:MAG: cell division protein FtsL [Patescibacteria group bacterium]|nr:cell division protein FtsL [Patescibacteria group bacterium]
MRRRLNLQIGNIARRLRMQPKTVTYLAIILFFAVGFVYVVAVNVVANKGAELRLLEVENKQLDAEGERLEVEAARLGALSVIEDGATQEVQVGDLEETEEDNKKVVVVPKLVQIQQQRYLPSYSSLASRE